MKPAPKVEASETITTIAKVFSSLEKTQKNAIDCSVAAFMACCEDLEPASSSVREESFHHSCRKWCYCCAKSRAFDRLNAFVRVRVTENIRPYFSGERHEQFTKALLVKQQVRKIELIERLMGRKANQANNIALEMVRDIEVATDYPPTITVRLSVPELVDITQRLTKNVGCSSKE